MEKNKKVLLGVLVGLFGLSFIFLASLTIFSRMKYLNSSGNDLQVITYRSENIVKENLTDSNNSNYAPTPVPTPTTKPESAPETAPEKNTTILVKVDWNDKLIEQNDDQGQENDSLTNYLAGTINSDEFKGQKLYLEAWRELGTSYKHYILKNSEKYYLEENNFEIDGINNLPEKIIFPDTEITLSKGYPASKLFADIETGNKIFTHKLLGNFYLSKTEGCLFVELPNHTALPYNLEIPFLNEEEGQGVQFNFYLANGKKNTEEYEYNKITGCGAMCHPLNTVNQPGNLKMVGASSSGDVLYALSNDNDPLLTELYNDKNTMAYLGKENEGRISKYTYQEFIDSNPLLFWKDPLNRWVKFTNVKFVSAAEMCKPAIYFYPEKTSNLKVEVTPNGGFTSTIPRYNNGWEIIADPSGKLTDLKTNQPYDYLYWEGIGINYPIQEKGWVIDQKNVNQFLNEKLTFLGLNNKEKNDFKTYWVNKLEEENHPYYKISFLDQKQFDELAPLKITGQEPATIIRVFMTAQGLDEKIKIPPQELNAPKKRDGFTVAEWGGTLLK